MVLVNLKDENREKKETKVRLPIFPLVLITFEIALKKMVSQLM